MRECDRGYEARSIRVKGVEIRLCVHPRHAPSPERIGMLERTLELLPTAHLWVLNYGHIRLSHPEHIPHDGGGSDPAAWIRISARSLAAASNFSPTLLHESGHVMDYHYHAMETLARTHPRLHKTLRETPHHGVTQFAGERFADCYMMYLLTQVAGLVRPFAASPQAYQGAARDTRFSALLSTPAFDGWTGPLSHLRVPPETP